MSTENIDIIVSEKGSAQAAAGIAGVGNAAEKSGQQADVFAQVMNTVKTVLGGLTVLKLVQEYKEMADTFTGLQNRLKLVTTNGADLAATQAKLLQVSNDTRSSFEATSNFYTKLALQSSQLGLDSKDLIPTITTINQLIAISGTSAEEAKSGLLQFSQGLVSNKFAGDELRSVLENIPALGQAIAKGLGTTTAGLRKMGENGQLSAKLVLDALQKSAPEIAKQFASITPTIGQAFQVLKNNLLSLVGTFDQANGISGFFARAILVVAQHLDLLVRTVKTAVEGLALFWIALQVQAGWSAFSAGVFAANARLLAYVAAAEAAGIQTTFLSRVMVAFQTPIAFVTNAFRTLWAVIAANPITALITIIGGIILLIYNFGDAIKLNASGSINLLGALVGTWNYLWGIMQEVGVWLGAIFTPYWNKLKAEVLSLWQLFLDFGSWLLGWLGKLIPSFAGAQSAIERWSAGITKAMVDASKAAVSTKDFKNELDKGAGSADAMKKAVAGYDSELNQTDADMKRLALTTRNAFGQMVTASDEWARRSGANFNSVKDSANSTTDAFAAASGGGSSGGGGGGSSDGGGGASQPTTGARTFDINGPNVQHTNAMLEGGVSTDGGSTFHFPSDDINSFLRYGYPVGNAVSVNSATAWNTLLEEAGSNDALVAQIKAAGHNRNVPGFANGGIFGVGGNGGVDSQLVSFLASPDEEVEVRNKNQQRRRRQNGGDGRNIVVNMNVAAPDPGSFRRSQPQVLMQLRSRLNNLG